MRLNSGRMKLALIFAMTLLLPGVISMSVRRPEEATPTAPASVATATEAGGLEKEITRDKNKLDDNEAERDYAEVGLTPLDDSPELDEAFSTASPQGFPTGGTREARANDVEEPPKENNKPEETVDVADNPIGLDEHDETEEEALNLIRLMIKRAVEDDDEGDEPQPKTIDEDDFSFSDLPKILEPLIEAFSNVESGAPAPDDFFSWLPALKDLLQPKEEPSATDLPSDPAGRSSDFPTPPEPSLQIAPASPPEQPAESEILPSQSLLERESVTPFQPTIPTLIPTKPPSPSDIPDSEGRSS